uniref:Uncharacterized protein n=1 Tax=Kalanchoe fedtschenkoi TaxID=63787 RepID=A0A7N0VNK7_KALFE
MAPLVEPPPPIASHAFGASSSPCPASPFPMNLPKVNSDSFNVAPRHLELPFSIEPILWAGSQGPSSTLNYNSLQITKKSHWPSFARMAPPCTGSAGFANPNWTCPRPPHNRTHQTI